MAQLGQSAVRQSSGTRSDRLNVRAFARCRVQCASGNPAQQVQVTDHWPNVNGSVVTPDGTIMARNVLQAVALAP